MTSSLSNFRDIVQLLHRIVRPDALHSRDLHTLVDKIHDALSGRDDCCSPIRVEAFPYHELLRPPTPPTLVIHPEQDAGEIVPNVVVTKEEPEERLIRNVVVQAPTPTPVLCPLSITKPLDTAILSDLHRDDDDDDVDVDAESVIEHAEGTPTATSDTEDSDVEPESESEPDSESEPESDNEGEEEEEEEDDDLELKVIKKQRYYWSPSSNRIYECLEEGYGDCLGTYDSGKIIPKA